MYDLRHNFNRFCKSKFMSIITYYINQISNYTIKSRKILFQHKFQNKNTINFVDYITYSL
jgi:hypothetical protein